MNGLNVRVGSEKNKKSLKRETKEDLSAIVETIDCNIEQLEELQCLFKAASMEEQIASLKQIIKELNLANKMESCTSIIKFYVEMFLALNVKSPLKIPILSLLVGSTGELKPLMQTTLEKRLREMFSKSEVDQDRIIHRVATLICCLEHSTESQLSIIPIKDDILGFLERSLKQSLNNLNTSAPPAQKLSIINCIHHCTRCAICLLQKTTVNCTRNNFNLMIDLIKDDQLPLDTRSNCGILCVMISKILNGGFDLKKLLKDVNSSDDLVLLCTISGMLNVLNQEDLQSVCGDENISLLGITVKSIIAIEERNSADCSLVLGSSRCLLLASKCMVTHPDLLTPQLLKQILPIIWIHLEHYMDAVRHLAGSTLSHIVSVGKATQNEDNFIFNTIIKDVSNISTEKRSKNAALSALIGYIPITELLLNSPGLIEGLLRAAKKSSGVTHAISSLVNLMTQHYKEKTDINEWYTLWVNPLLAAIGNKPNAALEHILTTVVKLHADVIHYITKLEGGCNYDVYLICLRVIRKFGLIQGKDDSTNWKGFISFSTLSSCMVHSDDEIRVSSFGLLTETLKTTEEFTEKELSLIQLFLKYNINNHNPAIRQKGFAYFKKFFVRLKDSMNACERRMAKSNRVESPEVPPKLSTVKLYNYFIRWLLKFCLENLFPGANFARRGTALNLLSLCCDYGFWTEQYQNESFGKVLLNSLLDTYEVNKSLGKNLLSKMPAKMLHFDDVEYVTTFLRNSIRLASSIRPPDSISAAYFISLLTLFTESGNIIRNIYSDLFDDGVDNLEDKEFTSFVCLRILTKELQKELKIAKISLLRAASSGPMYGLIFVIRYILQGVPLSSVKTLQHWKLLIKEIIATLFECDKTVAYVINNASPEGLLPMDFDYDLSNLEDDPDAPEVTAQMVLLCCWRTVKEVSLLLGELSQNAPISSPDSIGLITETQILLIGDHLTGLLAETKHRGAFEQAYIGFCKLTSRLWRYPTGNLHELPNKWLEETLNDIKTKTDLSATRRSAGIPFIVQGLVCTELEVGGGKCFHKGIQTLLKLAQDKESTVETRAHALNILRALFRHSLLGEMVSPYVAEGLAIAIQGFNSKTWAEKNSSTLLLSALMTRVFGVPRSSDSEAISWKNKMTGRIFFQRYPSLFSVLNKHLESATNSTMYPAIYPALLILGRLYPSSLEGTDSNLQLNRYIPYVNECAGSCILKTRNLAASAMVALITPNIYVDHINRTFIHVFNAGSENLCHGLLLQVLKLLRCIPKECLETIKNRSHVWVLVLLNILESKHSYISKECCIKIIITFATSFHKSIAKSNWLKVIEQLEETLFYPEAAAEGEYPDYGYSGYLMHSAILLTLLYYKLKHVNNSVATIIKLLDHHEYLVVRTTLNFTSTVLEDISMLIYEDVNDVDDVFLCYPEFNENLRREIISSETIAMVLTGKLQKDTHYEDKLCIFRAIKCLPKVYDVLEMSNESVIKFLAEFCDLEPELLGALVIPCIAAFITINKKMDISEDDFIIICNLIKKYSDCSCDYECRSSINSLLVNYFEDLLKISSPQNAFMLWSSVLKLLNDDESYIREKMCRKMSGHIVLSKGIEDFFAKFYQIYDDPAKAGVLLTWALGDCSFEDEILEYNMDRVFNKGDLNTYAEELIISRLSCWYLKQLLSKENSPPQTLLKEKVPPYLVEWIQQETFLLSPAETYEDIIMNFKASVDKFASSLKSVSPFRPFETKIALQELKLKNILKSVGLIDDDNLAKGFQKLTT